MQVPSWGCTAVRARLVPSRELRCTGCAPICSEDGMSPIRPPSRGLPDPSEWGPQAPRAQGAVGGAAERHAVVSHVDQPGVGGGRDTALLAVSHSRGGVQGGSGGPWLPCCGEGWRKPCVGLDPPPLPGFLPPRPWCTPGWAFQRKEKALVSANPPGP